MAEDTKRATPSQKAGTTTASGKASDQKFRQKREAARNVVAERVQASEQAAATGWPTDGGTSASAFFLAATSDPGRKAKQAAKHTALMDSAIGSYTTFGLDPEQDNFDALDLMAGHIIDLLTTNVYTFANLTRFEKSLLYRYFYKTNPVIGRLCDLHTDLPLSKTRLQAPADLPDIAKDYIMQFYERLLARLNFPEFLRDLVLAHTIYGEATALVDDFYKEFDRVLQNITHIEDQLFSDDPEDEKFLKAIEDAYDKEPKSVKLADRLKYIKLKFKSFFEPDYTGPDRLSVVPFYKISEQLENDDIDYVAIKYQLSESLSQLLSHSADNEFLKEVGYSEGLLAVLADPDLKEDKAITLDTDSYDGLPFIFRLRRPEGSSLIQRVLNECLEWEAAKRATRAKIESVGKVGRVITAEGLSEAQTAYLRSEVQMMLDDPGYAIVANFPIEWNEVNAELRQQLDDLGSATDKITETLALGGGMPLTLISGDSQYSGGSIKLEILNVEYHSFKQRVQSLIEEKLFKPIALRKGFVTVDDWGNPIIAYPRLTFSRVSLRDESVFDILFSLYQKGSLPVSILYDILNLDPDDVKRAIEADLWTVNDPNMNEMVRGLYTAATDDTYQHSNLVPKIMDALKLKMATAGGADLMEDGVHDQGDDFAHPGLPSSEDHPNTDDDGDGVKDVDSPADDGTPTDKNDPATKPVDPSTDAPHFDNAPPDPDSDWKMPKAPNPDNPKPADFDLGNPKKGPAF